MPPIKALTNARVCYHGYLHHVPIYIDTSTGLIIPPPLPSPPLQQQVETIDLKNRILAPAFIELQTNGALGVHFTRFTDAESYGENLGRALIAKGHGSILLRREPTVIISHNGGWEELREPDTTLMQTPSQSSIKEIYGNGKSVSAIKLVTLAPELEGSTALIETLTEERGIKVSLGHSAADFDTGVAAVQAGAKSLTHVFNAMNPLHHRTPGLAGLIASRESPYFSVIADGIHLHPATLAMAYRANPPKCILITDSVEMAGLPDGLYPGHAQIPHQQRKQGNKVTIEGTDTLIGSCSSLDECMRNLKQWSGCSLAQSVRCATENIANMMELGDRGMIDEGRRADFVVLDDTGQVLETWIGGKQVYERN
ncbi:MAG: hypothetical protein Q9179_002137 [Wetmoreana sp. 5 TL-2023]